MCEVYAALPSVAASCDSRIRIVYHTIGFCVLYWQETSFKKEGFARVGADSHPFIKEHIWTHPPFTSGQLL